MFKYLYSFIFLFGFLGSYGQVTTRYYDYRWEESTNTNARFYSEVYATDSGYVRKDYFMQERSMQMQGKYEDVDCKVPNGYFRYYHANRYLMSVGNYRMGKKNGLWLSYHPNQMMADSIVYYMGNRAGTGLSWHPNGYLKDSLKLNSDGTGVHVGWFDNGSPSFAGMLVDGELPQGKWKYFHKNGELSAVEIYSKGGLLSAQYFDEQGKEQPDAKPEDTGAVFPGGAAGWQKYLYKKIVFPQQYQLLNRDQAVVVVSFTVTETGQIEDAFVSTPFHPDFDKMALQAILKSPRWIPARNHNRNVSSWVSQPMVFSQPD